MNFYGSNSNIHHVFPRVSTILPFTKAPSQSEIMSPLTFSSHRILKV